jgi:hypothetical protein
MSSIEIIRLKKSVKQGRSQRWGASATNLSPGTYTLSCQIRDKRHTLLATCAVSPSSITVANLSDVAAYTLALTKAQTLALPVTSETNLLYADILYATSAGEALPTLTFAFEVETFVTLQV